MSRRVLIIGAAGRSFHNFNVVYRDSPRHEVVAFVATQIPFAARRVYPPALAGPRYPDGIPIYPHADPGRLVADLAVDEVAYSDSDVTYQEGLPTIAEVLKPILAPGQPPPGGAAPVPDAGDAGRS